MLDFTGLLDYAFAERLYDSAYHGLEHWHQVEFNGLLLASKTGADITVVRLFALFHDCMKQGRDGCEGHTVFEHPILAAEFMEEHLKDYIDEENLQEILGAVRTHMGKWTTSKYSSKTLEKPTTMFQKLVHNADYVASRKFIGGLTEWSQEENA